jgi:AraC-like DNA-binding protein
MPWATAITGFHIEQAVARVGGDPAALGLADRTTFEDRMELDVLVATWERAVALTQRRDIPAIAADYVTHDEKSLLAFCVSNQPRFREAMQCYVRYFPAVSDAYAWQVEVGPEHAHLFAAPGGPVDRFGFQLHYEFEVADSVRSAALVTGGIARPSAVWFAHAAPPQSVIEALANVLGVEPRFGAREYAVLYPLAVLDAPLPHARPALAAVIEERLQQHVSNGRSTSSRARVAIHKLIEARRECSVDAIAAMLAMSRRALERALATESTSASALLDEERRQYALAWLPSHSVEEVALRLGYSDRRAFARAFRRWTGTSPRGRGTDSA